MKLAARSDESAFLELQYLLRKAQRDIDMMDFKMGNCRKELVTLCGTTAVDKADVLLAEESTNDSAPHIVTRPGQSDQVTAGDADQPTSEAGTETGTETGTGTGMSTSNADGEQTSGEKEVAERTNQQCRFFA